MNSDLNSEVSALRNQVYVLLVALIVVSGTLTVFLYRQASVAGKDVESCKQIISGFNQNQNQIVTFINQIVAYGQAHPDFSKSVLAKYGIEPRPGMPPGAAPVAPKK